ncbi:MAG: Tab2 family RNA-binding protein, partial [Thermosynechococcaceae cyanobacterium]
MTCWQVDYYRRPLIDEAGQPLWELVICDAQNCDVHISVFCSQATANSDWLKQQFQLAFDSTQTKPDCLQVFRPASLNLVKAAADSLGIPVEATRRTSALKTVLKSRDRQYPQMLGYTHEPYDPIAIERPPPQPLPEHLLGDQWRFVALSAPELEAVLLERPIAIKEAPETLLPSQQPLASSTLIPGLVIDGGRQSMRLARWLKEQQPVFLQAQATGVVLESGLCDRTIL